MPDAGACARPPRAMSSWENGPCGNRTPILGGGGLRPRCVRRTLAVVTGSAGKVALSEVAPGGSPGRWGRGPQVTTGRSSSPASHTSVAVIAPAPSGCASPQTSLPPTRCVPPSTGPQSLRPWCDAKLVERGRGGCQRWCWASQRARPRGPVLPTPWPSGPQQRWGDLRLL